MPSFLTVIGAVFWMVGLSSCTVRGEIGAINFVTGAVFMCAAVIVQEMRRIWPIRKPAAPPPAPAQKP